MKLYSLKSTDNLNVQPLIPVLDCHILVIFLSVGSLVCDTHIWYLLLSVVNYFRIYLLLSLVLLFKVFSGKLSEFCVNVCILKLCFMQFYDIFPVEAS
jgi:hypothetical protein